MEKISRVPRQEVREPIIAGVWYPGNPQELASAIDGYLDRAERVEALGQLVGLVVPHAGYAYSGQVAAHAYKQLAGLRVDATPVASEGFTFDRVVVISPSHHPHGGQLLVTEKGYYETPLGLVKVDAELLGQVLEGAASLRVRRLAHDQEHSLEIQLPFLQRVLPSFQLVPIMMEDQTLPACRVLAEALGTALEGQRTLLVASTDLSHFHSYATARTLDLAFLAGVERFDPESLAQGVVGGECEACGAGPVIAVLLAARKLGARQAKVLSYANSGDVTGDRWRVVGYGAAAIWK